MIKYIIIAAYLAIINIIGCALVYSDKRKAQNGKWRVRESTFFIISAIGGAVGVYFSMLKCRHKTKHKRFMIGIPAIVMAELLAVVGMWLMLKPIVPYCNCIFI